MRFPRLICLELRRIRTFTSRALFFAIDERRRLIQKTNERACVVEVDPGDPDRHESAITAG
jgi:hypothetical protein